MSPPHFPLRRFLIGSVLLTPLAARADEPATLSAALRAPLSDQAEEVVRDISQREFADAATTQVGFLKELRAWRNTLRGSGTKREWGISPLRNQKIALSLGNVAPAEVGGGAGVTAKWRGVEIGTTAQPNSVDEALLRFDGLLSGEKIKEQSAPAEFNWLRAKLLDSPGAQLEIMAASASQEVGAGSSNWSGGEFGSAKAKLQLPAKWSLSGNFARAEVERDADNSATEASEMGAASAWSLAAAGPIAHPFGVARASAQWQAVGAGYVAPTAQSGAAGGQNGSLEVAQELKIGALSGQLQFGAATQRPDTGESISAGEQLEQNSARSAAQMRLALTPNLSVTGNGQWNSAAATRALAASSGENGAVVAPESEREMSRQLVGDFGVQWNFSRALSLAASMGVSSQNSRLESGETMLSGPQSDELRRALELRQKSGANDIRIRFSQRAAKTAAASSADQASAAAPISQWRLEAARPLVGQMRLKTILDFASDAGRGESARRMEAQFQLARAARFDARYREGNFSAGLLPDDWSSTFAASSSAAKQWSTRFGLGSAASGAGLGLSVEMVRSQGDVPDSYRVGVQFK